MTYNANQSRFSLDDKGVEKLATPTNGGMQPLTLILKSILETFSVLWDIDYE